MTDPTAPQDAGSEGAPVDPCAATKHTLPSGKVVERRSHRTLTGADHSAVISAQTQGGLAGIVDMRNVLIARLFTEIEPGSSPQPQLDGSVEAVLAQRIDDHRALYLLTDEAMALVMGTSVIVDYEAYEDPKAPTTPSSEPSPGSPASQSR